MTDSCLRFSPAFRSLASLALVAGLSLPRTASATVTDSFCSFQPPLTNFTLNQNAFNAFNTEIRLTDAITGELGSFFYDTPIVLTATTAFHAHFTFQMGPSATGGEGIAFVLQNSPAGPAALGLGGAGLGFAGTAVTGITPSVVIAFDTVKNSGTNANNVTLFLDGSDTVYTATGVPGFTMANGGVLNGWVDYDGSGNITASVSQTETKPATATLTGTVNLFTELGAKMYVGFSSATGTSPTVNQHDVFELELSTGGIPCACEGDSACPTATPACATSGICAVCSGTNHTACTGATPTCDVPTNTCVGCLTNANCASPKPICGTGLACRACASAADCNGSTPQCATTGASAGDCVACIADANCPPSTPRCTTSNTCVQCESAADCGGDTPVCTNGACKACVADSSCGGTTPACEVWGACGQCSATNATACVGGAKGICDFPTGACVGCEFSSDCSGATPTCNTATHTCRACATNADCMGNPGGNACVTTGMKAGSCVTCAANADCTSPAAPICDTVANECVQCLTSTNCGGATPVCNSAQLCVQCVTSADCASATGDGSASNATPVCDVASATCTGCANDFSATNPGELPCPTAALPACQPAGSALAGQCGLCSALNDSACVTQPTIPVCITASATCGCVHDTDCNSGSYCDTAVASSGVCTTGCRDMGDGGTNNCPTGQFCSATNGAIGTCMTQPCNSNTDCKAPNPVCNTIAQPHSCVPCLNTSDCAAGQVCDTTDHCVECTMNQTKFCSAATVGSACLASETCGCATDANCGASTSGRVCNTTTHACEQGCRGMSGNSCPTPDACTSTTSAIGQCQGPLHIDAAVTKDAGADAAHALDSGSDLHVVTDSPGCSCRLVSTASSDSERAAGVGGLALAVLFASRRRSRRHERARRASH